MRRRRLLVLIPLLSLFLTLPAFTAAFYAPPPLPSDLTLKTVHTTTINVTGPASKSLTLDIQGQDSLSLITALSLTLAAPLTNFSIQIVQLNSLPSNIANIGGSPILPDGKPLLYFYFNIDATVQSQISQADFYVRVPATELQLFSANPIQVMIQKYLYSWSAQTSYLNNTAIEDYGAQYYIYRVFSSAELTLYAVTDKEAFALSPESLFSAGIVIAVATLLVLLRMRSKRLDLPTAENPKG